ncbi:LPS assembly lipoprotein LptE [Rhodobacter maris]|uniref:LPS-assembly lipoprotein n=1 Tax=Rhodobacter maris TaxID=446682 RepID=A0A285RLR4_9RHOB|nr:LPS-assembly lipoprotein [Rhodobacter maris]
MLGSALALAGCGFTPAYGPAGGGGKLLGGVAPDAPQTRDDFAFVRRIAERLNPPGTVRYRLAYKITTDRLGQAITPDGATTRYSLTGRAEYRLHDAGSDAVLLAGTVASFTSWSASGTVVATSAAEEDAHRRLMRMLADQTITRLLAGAGTLPQ